MAIERTFPSSNRTQSPRTPSDAIVSRFEAAGLKVISFAHGHLSKQAEASTPYTGRLLQRSGVVRDLWPGRAASRWKAKTQSSRTAT